MDIQRITDEQPITITREKLMKALEQWDRESKEQAWLDRSDPDRHRCAADYLLELM